MIFVKSYIYDRNTLLLLYILFITNIYEKYDIQKCLIILLTKYVNSDIITIFTVKEQRQGLTKLQKSLEKPLS